MCIERPTIQPGEALQLNLNTNCKPKSRSRQGEACTNVVNIFSSNEHGFGDVNISAILNSFQMGYDKRVRPNYGGKLGSKNKHPDCGGGGGTMAAHCSRFEMGKF